jgi:hypothetical protein
MGLLSRKPKYTMEEFCRCFYDSQVFDPHVGGTNVGLVLWQYMYNSIAEADESFKSIDFSKFQEEMKALRMELFALAWFDRFKLERYAIPQSLFTRRYLEENGRAVIWDAMSDYNRVLARSFFLTRTGEEMKAREGRAKLASISGMRHEMAMKWVATNIGDKHDDAFTEEDTQRLNCASRVFNRIGVDIRREDCVAVKALSGGLASRLGCDAGLNSEAFFRIQAYIYGFYQGAKEAIRHTNIQD